MTRQDTWAEALAQIRTAVDSHSAEAAVEHDTAATHARHLKPKSNESESLGAPASRWEDLADVEHRLCTADSAYDGFGTALRAFILEKYPNFAGELQSNIRVSTPTFL